MKIHVPDDDVQTAERNGMKKEDSPYPWPILIKFNNHWTKRDVYKDRRQLKGEKIFFNENFTKESASLFYEARKLQKSAFTIGGIVFVKKQRNSKPVKLLKEPHLPT